MDQPLGIFPRCLIPKRLRDPNATVERLFLSPEHISTCHFEIHHRSNNILPKSTSTEPVAHHVLPGTVLLDYNGSISRSLIDTYALRLVPQQGQLYGVSCVSQYHASVEDPSRGGHSLLSPAPTSYDLETLQKPTSS